MTHAQLRDRGYFDTTCMCPVHVKIGGFHEVEWSPKCPVHKDDVTGSNYRSPNR